MHEQNSFTVRIAAKHKDDDVMAPGVEEKLYAMAHRATGTVMPGMTVKAQRIRAWENLGRPPMWRLLSAWYRDGSASWSAAAVFDFQRRYDEWQKREAARSVSAAKTEQARQATMNRELLVRLRDQHAAELRRLESRLALMDGGTS